MKARFLTNNICKRKLLFIYLNKDIMTVLQSHKL